MVVSAIDIVELSLSRLSVFAPGEVSVDDGELSRSLFVLNSLIKHLAATNPNLWHFIPESQYMDLTADEDEYNLNDELDTPLQFVERVFAVDSSGNETEVTLIRKSSFDAIRNEYLNSSGLPEWCFIEKKSSPKLFLLGAPSATITQLRIEGQGYPPDVTESNGQVQIGYPDAWGLWLSEELAVRLGSGHIIKLPKNELDDLKRDALGLKEDLETYALKENVRRPRFTRMDQL